MKIDITFEHTDLVKQVAVLLATKGLRPIEGEEICFVKMKTAKGEPEEFQIKVACEAGELLSSCPFCKGSLVEQASSTPEQTAPRHYRVAEEDPATQAPVVLDETLEESLEPFAGAGSAEDGEDDDAALPSIASLRATSDRLAVQKERERRQRRQSRLSPSMAGESVRPPKPGEGI